MTDGENKYNSFTHHTEKNFTIIQNELIRSPFLSCKGFKLLCIGLSHSGKWLFRKSQISTCFKEGEHTLNEAMKELREIGYLHLESKRNDDGKMEGHKWFWFPEPISVEEFKKIFQDRIQKKSTERVVFGGSVNPLVLRRQSFKKKKNRSNRNSDFPVKRPEPEKPEPDRPILFYECLKELPLPDQEKIQLTRFCTDEERLKGAVEFATAKEFTPDNLGAVITSNYNNNRKPNKIPDSFVSQNKAFCRDFMPAMCKVLGVTKKCPFEALNQGFLYINGGADPDPFWDWGLRDFIEKVKSHFSQYDIWNDDLESLVSKHRAIT